MSKALLRLRSSSSILSTSLISSVRNSSIPAVSVRSIFGWGGEGKAPGQQQTQQQTQQQSQQQTQEQPQQQQTQQQQSEQPNASEQKQQASQQQQQTQQQQTEQKEAPQGEQSQQSSSSNIELEAKFKVALAEKDKIIAEKDKMIAEFKDRLVRQLAETENIRTRAKRDIEDGKKFALQGFSKSLLEVADTLSIATQNVAQQAEQSTDPTLKTMFEGVQMTERILLKVFEQNGIKKMDSMGAKFDPNLHMVVFQMEDATKEPGTIGHVMKEGYLLNDRVIRAAQVGTIKKPAQPAATVEATSQQSE